MSGKGVLYLLFWGLGAAFYKFILYSQFLHLTLASKVVLVCTPVVFYLSCFGTHVLSSIKKFFSGLVARKSLVESLTNAEKGVPSFFLFIFVCFSFSFIQGLLIVLLSAQRDRSMLKMLVVEITCSLIWTIWARKKNAEFINDATTTNTGF